MSEKTDPENDVPAGQEASPEPEPEPEHEHDEDFVDHEGPGEHDHRLLGEDDDEDEKAPCPACGVEIWAYATECPACGRAFGGEAWQVDPGDLPDEGEGAMGLGKNWLWRMTTLALLAGLAYLLARGLW